MVRIFLILNLSFFIVSCASTRDVKSFEDSLQAGYIPLEEEVWAKKQADKLHTGIKAKGLLYRDAEVQAYLDRVKATLLKNDPNFQSAIQVHIMRSPGANAMALPNGFIYLNSGLFTLLETEDQLAAIFAHEIAHITQRHSVKSVISKKNTLIGAHIADFATGGFGLVYIPAMASIMGFSRDQESEADTVGVSTLKQTGYIPNAMMEAFEKMQKMPELKYVENSIYSSHPSQAKRIADLRQTIRFEEITGNSNKLDNGFLTVKAKLMEENIKMRLKSRQYHLASNIIDEAHSYYQQSNKIDYYRGEVYRGFYRHPDDAAVEKNWIDTGEVERDEKLVGHFESAKKEYLEKAEQAYTEALKGENPYTLAYKRLGEIKKDQGTPELAEQWYRKYLKYSPDAKDRRYINRMIERLNIN